MNYEFPTMSCSNHGVNLQGGGGGAKMCDFPELRVQIFQGITLQPSVAKVVEVNVPIPKPNPVLQTEES